VPSTDQIINIIPRSVPSTDKVIDTILRTRTVPFDLNNTDFVQLLAEIYAGKNVIDKLSPYTLHALGAIPEPDRTQYKPDFTNNFKLAGATDTTFPTSSYLSLDLFPPVMNQGQLGSCVGCSVTAVLSYELKRYNISNDILSPLFYYNTGRRLLEYGSPFYSRKPITNGGLYILSSINNLLIKDAYNSDMYFVGTPSNTLWPYILDKNAMPLNWDIAPPEHVYESARSNYIIKCDKIEIKTINDIDSIKSRINQGYAITIGLIIFASVLYNNDDTVKLKCDNSQNIMTSPTEYDANHNPIGGHAVVIVGYDDNYILPNSNSRGSVRCRNSWGQDWWDNGYFYIPYEFITNKNYVWDCNYITVSLNRPPVPFTTNPVNPTNPTNPINPTNPNCSSSLSTAAIIGISVSSGVAFLIIVFVIYYYFFRSKSTSNINIRKLIQNIRRRYR
jgi:hypothetical protein